MSWLQVTPNHFDLTLLAYRPLRRAVLRATADGSETYLKVLRPERADRLAVRAIITDLQAEKARAQVIIDAADSTKHEKNAARAAKRIADAAIDLARFVKDQ